MIVYFYLILLLAALITALTVGFAMSFTTGFAMEFPLPCLFKHDSSEPTMDHPSESEQLKMEDNAIRKHAASWYFSIVYLLTLVCHSTLDVHFHSLPFLYHGFTAVHPI